MARNRLTIAQRLKGAKKAVKNPRTPAGLKKYLRKFIEEHSQ
jgi:hypothetical protein